MEKTNKVMGSIVQCPKCGNYVEVVFESDDDQKVFDILNEDDRPIHSEFKGGNVCISCGRPLMAYLSVLAPNDDRYVQLSKEADRLIVEMKNAILAKKED